MDTAEAEEEAAEVVPVAEAGMLEAPAVSASAGPGQLAEGGTVAAAEAVAAVAMVADIRRTESEPNRVS